MLMATQSPTTVVCTTVVMLLVDTAFVFMRVKARRIKSQPLKADDWFSVLALALVFGLDVVLIHGVHQHALAYPTPNGSLKPRTALTEINDKIVITMRLQYIFIVLSIAALGAIKLSVLCFYRRIFVVEKRNRRDLRNIAYILVMTLVVLWTGAFLFAFMFACKGNFKAWWSGSISLITNCVNTFELLYGFAISDFMTDLIILVLPISAIWSLHLPRSLKFGVLAVFSLGTLATVASMIRMIWVIWSRQANFNPSFDQNLLITTMLFWCMIEASLSIIACCLPVLNAFLRHEPLTSSFRSFWTRLSSRSNRSQIYEMNSGSDREDLQRDSISLNKSVVEGISGKEASNYAASDVTAGQHGHHEGTGAAC